MTAPSLPRFCLKSDVSVFSTYDLMAVIGKMEARHETEQVEYNQLIDEYNALPANMKNPKVSNIGDAIPRVKQLYKSIRKYEKLSMIIRSELLRRSVVTGLPYDTRLE